MPLPCHGIIRAVDQGHVVAMMLCDLSSAFDTNRIHDGMRVYVFALAAAMIVLGHSLIGQGLDLAISLWPMLMFLKCNKL